MLDTILQSELFTFLAAIFAVCISFVNAARLSYIDRYYFNAKNGMTSVFKTTKNNAWALWAIVTIVAIVHLGWIILVHDYLRYTKLDYLKTLSLLYLIVSYVSLSYYRTTSKTLSILLEKTGSLQIQNPTEKAVRIWHSYRLCCLYDVFFLLHAWVITIILTRIFPYSTSAFYEKCKGLISNYGILIPEKLNWEFPLVFTLTLLLMYVITFLMKVMWDEWQEVCRGYRKGRSHVWLQIEVASLIGGICLIVYNALTFIDAFTNESPEIFYNYFSRVYSGGAIFIKMGFLILFIDFLINAWQARQPNKRNVTLVDGVIVIFYILILGQSIKPYYHATSLASLFTGIDHIQLGDFIYILIACILILSIYTGLIQMLHPGQQAQKTLFRPITVLFGAFLFFQLIKIGGLPMKFFQFKSIFTLDDYGMIHRLLISWWIVMGLTLIYLLPHSFSNELPHAINRREDWDRKRQREISAMSRLVSLQFLRHIIGEKGTSMIVGIILHTSGCLLLLKYSNVGSGEDYAQIIMRIVPAFILSGAAAILEPIATGWRGRREDFRAQMGRTLLNQILGSMSEHLVVMGFGNLGSSVVAKQWATVERTHSYSLSSDFEVVVEPSLRLRPIYKKIAIVDISPDCLLEKYEVGGITVGIAPLYAHAMLAVGSNHHSQYRRLNDYLCYHASSINFAAVCGDGGGQETLRVARGYTAKTMVCAINKDYWYEQCLGDRQHLNINEESRRGKYSPIIL